MIAIWHQQTRAGTALAGIIDHDDQEQVGLHNDDRKNVFNTQVILLVTSGMALPDYESKWARATTLA